MSDLATLPYTHHDLMAAFAQLGVMPGQIVMLHASVKAVGAVLGGPNVILQALLDTLTPQGTLMMYVGWQDMPDLWELPPTLQTLYYEQHPPFDPLLARAVRDHGILAEFLRTWRGAQRSLNPEASMVAVGGQAAWLTQDHPLHYGYGAGSPLAKLVAAQGKVLMLGASLDHVTLLHYAENRAALRHKNIVRYPCPLLRDGATIWVDIEDYDTGEPHADYSFEGIALAYLAQGGGRRGRVGNAASYLFDAADLTQFAIRWLEARFGSEGENTVESE